MKSTDAAPRPVAGPSVLVREGWIYIYHVFDVADEINLQGVETALIGNPSTQRIKLRRSVPRSIQLSDPPVEFSLSAWQPIFEGQPLHVAVSARVYSFGAISIAQRLQVDPLWDWERWLGLSVAIQGDLFHRFAQVARQALQEVQTLIAACVVNPTAESLSEDYVIFYVKEFTSPLTASEVPAHFDIARLLLAERSPISESVRRDLDESTFSYSPEELIVVDWNSAFVYDPSGSTEVPEILDYATTQLLELRYYDTHLDSQLQRIYREIQAAGPRTRWVRSSGRYTALTRQMLVLIIEITELTDKIENSFKIIGDTYYTRVYAGAVRRFRLRHWRESIERKLSRVSQIYSQLNDQVTLVRSQTIELAILILIVVEVALEVARWFH